MKPFLNLQKQFTYESKVLDVFGTSLVLGRPHMLPLSLFLVDEKEERVDKTSRFTKMDRRSFLAATAGSVAALGLSGCAPESKLSSTGNAGKAASAEGLFKVDEELAGDGKWVAMRCQAGCGGECSGWGYLKDGILLRTKSDDEGEDTLDRPQRRRCPRGRASRQTIWGPGRLKYPMKRKHWEPFTGGDKSLRGRDEWVRISWDEAFDIVAAELQHAIDNYGNESILAGGGEVYDIAYLMNSIGSCGSVIPRDTTSCGSTNIAHLMGLPTQNLTETNMRWDLPNAEFVVLYGMNPVWASAGNQAWYLYEGVKHSGAQIVYVGPSRNVSASLLEAKWIPVRPGTDTAFCLAVTCEMFKLDEERGGIIDWEFLEKYTVGIDGDHMAADAKLDENFRDHLFGTYDGQVYDAEWAAPICGCEAEDIRWFAENMRKDQKVSMFHSYPAARNLDSENWLRLFMTIGFMGGHIGKPGHTCGSAYHAGAWRYTEDHFVSDSMNGGFEIALNFNNTLGMHLQASEYWQDVLDGRFRECGDHVNFSEPEERDLDIHVIFTSKVNTLTTKPGVMQGIEALRKVDFVVTTAWDYTPNAQYSDVILPITTVFEIKGLSGTLGKGMYSDHEAMYLEANPVPPVYEAMDIRDILNEIGSRMGVENCVPISRDQYVFDGIAAVTYNNAPGGPQKLVSITQEDIDRWGVEGEPQEGFMPLAQLEEEGLYKHEHKEGDDYYIGYQDYIADPEGNPRPTPSGKWEIYCQTFADTMKMLAFDDHDWKPYPTYIEPTNGWGSEEQQRYRFRMITPHYIRRNHSLYDDNPYLREAFEQPVFINAQDAAELGVAMGDTVLLSNQYGKVLRRASVVQSIMPGVISLPHGAWPDVDEETGIDRAGASNMLTPQITSGMGTNAYNSSLVNIEKWTGEPLPRDCEMPDRVAEAN